MHLVKNAISVELCNKLIERFNSDAVKPHRIKGPRNPYTIENNIRFYEYTMMNPGKSSFTEGLMKGLKEYRELNPFLLKVKNWGLENMCQMQKYTPGEHYYLEHCEHGLRNPKRIIAWMFYLNDIFSGGGGTSFPQQRVSLNSRAGDLHIWPAFWTYSHLGIPSTESDKYIITGWCAFNDQESK